MPYIGRGLEKGNYLKLDDISSQFDGSKTTFNLTVGGSAHVPGSSYSLLVSLSGIIQEGEAAYTLDQNQITFAAAPQAVDDCYIISLGTPIGIGVPGDGTVSGPQFAKPFNYENFFYLDHTTQRVGIGTTVPTQSLDVYDGNIAIRDPATASQFLGFYHNRNVLKASIDKTGNNLTFENVDSGIIDFKNNGSSRVGIGSTGKIFFASDDNTYFYRPGADTLGFLVGGNEKLRINGDRVIIGLSNSNNLPTFNASTTFANVYTNNPGAFNAIAILGGHTTGAAFVKFGDRDNERQGQIGYYNQDDSMRFFVNGDTTDKVRITSTGKVGIGTTNPTEILDVRGNLVVAEALAVNRPRIVLSAPDDGTNYRHLFGANLQVNSSGTFTTPTANISGGGWEYLSANSLNAHGEIRYLSAPDTNATSSTPEERFRINSGGNVGIGTDNAITKLHVGGNFSVITQSPLTDQSHTSAARGGNALFVSNNSTVETARFYCSAAGNTKIHIECSSNNGESELHFCDQEDRTSYTGGVDHYDNSSGKIIYDHSDDFFKFDTNRTEKLRITSAGKVGIGTDNPDSLLHVYNDAGDVTSFVEAIAGDALLNLSNSGNGNYSGINFIRERGSGQTGKNGGSIFMPSNTANNEAFLYIQAQSTSAEAGVTGALSANNGVRLKLHGDDGIFSIETGDDERLRIDENGKVGIGTDDPDSKLHVSSTDNIVTTFERTGSTYGARIAFVDDATPSGSPAYIEGYNGDLELGSRNTPLIQLSNSMNGRIGMGTDTIDVMGPYFLQIYGSTQVNDNFKVTGVSTFSGDVNVGGAVITNPGSTSIDFSGSITASDVITAGALLHEGDTDTLVHFSANDTIDFKTGGSSKLQVNNFGISLQNDTTFNVNGGRLIVGDSTGITTNRIVLGNNNDLYLYHNSVDSYIENNTGILKILGNTIQLGEGTDKVGIGTTAPRQKFEVIGTIANGRPTFQHESGYGGLQIAGPEMGSGASLFFTRGYASSGMGTTTFSLFMAGGDQSLNFVAGDASEYLTKTKMMIENTGFVGIGTRNPDEELHVYGNGGDPSIFLENGATGSSSDTIIKCGIGGTIANNYIYFGDADDSDAGRIRYNHNSDFMTFNTNGDERVRIFSDGRMNIGGTNEVQLTSNSTAVLHLNGAIVGANIDSVFGTRIIMDDDDTGTTSGGDRERGCILAQFNGNASGGDTTDETRLWNIHSDVNATADYDNCYGVYGDVRTSHTAGTITAMRGVYGIVQTTSSGSISEMVGIYGIAQPTTNSSGTVADLVGGKFRANMAAGNSTAKATDIFGVWSQIDNDNNVNQASSGTRTALFYGNYDKTTGLNDPQGIRIDTNVPNYFRGGLAIGQSSNTLPTGKLDVAGDVNITGDLNANSGTKSFRIAHPLVGLSTTKDLVHAAIEGPQVDLIYRGKVDLVNGTATVNLDTKSGMTEGTFAALTRDVQCFTTNETGWINVKGSVTGNQLTIIAQENTCTDTISWMVIGERQDDAVKQSGNTDADGKLILEPNRR